MITALLFLAVLFVLVLVHEWGHYIVAKKTGMRVDEFGIGFPPKLFGVKKGETEYTLNALPLGGFVRIYGESLVHDDAAEADPDHARAMWAKPKWAQALVLIAGVTMNVVLAFVLYFSIFLMGVPTAIDETAPIPEGARLYVTNILPESPLVSELTPGTIIAKVTAGDEELRELAPSAFTAFVGEHLNETLVLTIEIGEEVKEVSVTPVAGIIPGEPDRKAIGVGLRLFETRSQGIDEAALSAVKATGNGLVAITGGLYTLVSQAIVGKADLSQVAGPIGIAGMVGEAATFGIASLFSFVAIISLNLAIINLLPFPALDGGRLLLLFGEAVFRRPANTLWTQRLNAAGFLILMGLMLLVTYGDIMKLLD